MILQTSEISPIKGGIAIGKGNHWEIIRPSYDGWVLTCDSNNVNGCGLGWIQPSEMYTKVPSHLDTVDLKLSSGLAINGVATIPAQAALPITLGDVIAILVSVGLCAAS